MGNQSQFDQQVATLNEKLDGVSAKITAEAEQVRQFIADNPGVDTSALDGVAARLDGLNVSGIFEPPTPDPAPEVPADPPAESEPTA